MLSQERTQSTRFIHQMREQGKRDTQAGATPDRADGGRPAAPHLCSPSVSEKPSSTGNGAGCPVRPCTQHPIPEGTRAGARPGLLHPGTLELHWDKTGITQSLPGRAEEAAAGV